MTLVNALIADRSNLDGLYQYNMNGRLDFLEDLGFLPLRAEDLVTTRGIALSRLALLTYLRGSLDRDTYAPRVRGDNDYISDLQSKLEPIGVIFRSDEAQGIVKEKSGAWGRLLHAMGVPVPQKRKSGERRATKTRLGRSLPKFISDVCRSRMREDQNRLRLLEIMGEIVASESYRFDTVLGPRSDDYSHRFSLREHGSEERGREYACQVGNLINDHVLPPDIQIGIDQVVMKARRGGDKFSCSIALTDRQVAYLNSEEIISANLTTQSS